MNPLKFTATLLLIALISFTAHAIKCWECDNAIDDEDCMSRGKLRNCNENEERCFTETRLIHDGRKLITRRCKQQLACFNNNYQNLQPAWDPTQCHANGGSVCRCCCGFDECNAIESTQCLKNVVIEEPEPISPPIPEPLTCKLPEKPINGDVFCNDFSNIVPVGYSCEYICDPGYEMEGKNITTCLEEFDEVYYDSPAPKCVPKCSIKCPEQTKLRRVTKQCTSGDYYGSVCSFTCQGNNQTPNPGDVMENECTRDGIWSNPAPCCRLPCPPHTVMDLFIVLDSSSSVGPKNFEKMRVFVAEVLSAITLDEEHTQAFIMTYNIKPNKNNQVVLKQNENFEERLSKLRTIPAEGRGTMTGKALKYVHEKFLHQPDNREGVTDVVLLITDGRSQDQVGEISQKLRNDGVEVFAIGVTNRVNEAQLLEITGSAEKMWPNINNFDDFTTETASKIGNYICEKSCA